METKQYNVYHFGMKLNKMPIDQTEVDKIKKKKEIIKVDRLTGEKKSIPVNQLKFTKCIIV